MEAAKSPLIGQLGAKKIAGKKTINSANKLGQKEFLKLIVAQVKHQDPFKPMKNGAFISQLAQFGTVDGVNRLNATFSKFATTIKSNQALGATALIGKQVLVSGNQINLKKTGSAEALINSAGKSGVATVTIKDSNGQTVRTISVAVKKTGVNSFVWDGLNQRGQRAPAGQYSLSASLASGKKNVNLSILVRHKVESVNINHKGSIHLGLDTGKSIAFNKVKQVSG